MKDLLQNRIKTIILRSGADIKNGCVLAVGAFDGVHIGHRAMLKRLSERARAMGLPACVFTFDITDSPKGDKPLLALDGKKLSLLRECGVDAVFSAPFGEIRDITAEAFARELLFSEIKARAIVCGYDFRFGKDRAGDAEFLKLCLAKEGVEVITQKPVLYRGEPVSSTLIRSLIAKGDIESANTLLGRRFCFNGEIVHGRRIGRRLGFPTVNQKYPLRLQQAAFGVYAVYCNIGGERFCGVANIGVKPTVSNENEPLCETHIFGIERDLYGSDIETELAAFIREERRFSSLEELKAQLVRDRESALNILKECNE